MTHGDHPMTATEANVIRIITVYDAAHTPTTRGRVRCLSLVSLLVAALWLVEALHYPRVLNRWNTVNRLIHGRLLMAEFSEGTNLVDTGAGDLSAAGGFSTTVSPPGSDHRPPIDAESLLADLKRRQATRWITFYAWQAVAGVAGAWLTLAALVGLTGRILALRLHRQAALLMLLSTAATVAGLWVMERWAGMPLTSWELAAKIGGAQSAYAWVVLLACRLLR